MRLNELLGTEQDLQVAEVETVKTDGVEDTYTIYYEFHSGEHAGDILGGTITVVKSLLDKLDIPYTPGTKN